MNNAPLPDSLQDSSTTASDDVPVVAVVLAAGMGTRFDPKQPKQLLEIDGKTLVAWSVEAFEHSPEISDIIVVASPCVQERAEEVLGNCSKLRMVIPGGVERSDSTMLALQALTSAGIPEQAKILIHDAARPFVAEEAIKSCIDALDGYDAATLAVQSTDTILLGKDSSARKIIDSVPERSDTYRAQTPQGFRFHTIRQAYDAACADPSFHPTDDTRAVVEYLHNVDVAIVAGDDSNIKITRPEDLPQARHIAESIRQARAKERMQHMLADAMQAKLPDSI